MSELLEQLELLAGQESTLKDTFDKNINLKAFDEGDIGVSQMNELLLTAGFDRVTEDFFTLLHKGAPVKYVDETRIHGLIDLKQKVYEFRKLATLKYGNFKFAFKHWSQMNNEQLKQELKDLLPLRSPPKAYYTTRTAPLEDINEIPINDRSLLGHISDPIKDADLLKRQREVQKIAENNLRKYLTFAHMDVYIATSMRRYRDYISVGKFVQKVFNYQDIKELRLRYFDPTQTYSADRFCEGLAESLMLKRAKCAIYCAQEKDTLGKDSELAITLAQGKPVLVYVPRVTDLKKYKEELIQHSSEENLDSPIKPLRRDFISYFPDQALKNPELLQTEDKETIASKLALLFQQRFEDRANILQCVHPLSMQVDLNTGVAHGVLLTRSAKECAKVLRKVLLGKLEFDLEEQTPSYPEYACGDYKKN